MAYSAGEPFASTASKCYNTTDAAINNASGSGSNAEKATAELQHEGLRTVSSINAYLAMVKSNLGPGALALPFSFARVGWAVGVPVILVVMAQGVYVFMVLVACKRAVARPGINDLGDVAEVALGRCGRIVADLCVFIVQSGVCTISISVVTGSLAVSTGLMNKRLMTLLVAPFFEVIAMLRFVAQLSWPNLFGSVAMAVAVIVSTTFGAQRLGELGNDVFLEHAWPHRPFSDPVMLAASVFYAFEGLALVIPIEKEMARPSAFPMVAIIASMALAIAFLGVSFMCGIAYGEDLESGSIVTFLASQPSTGASRMLLQVTNHLVTAAIFVTFPMQLLPNADILAALLDSRHEADGGSGRAEGTLTDAGIVAPGLQAVPDWVWQRSALVVSYLLMAMAVEDVSLLVSFFGAAGQTCLGMLVPLCHLALMRSGSLAASTLCAVLDGVIVVFCTVIMVYGSQRAFRDILAQW